MGVPSLVPICWLMMLVLRAEAALYELSVHSFEKMPPELGDILDYGTVRLSKKARNTFVIAGTCTLHQNLGDEVMVTWEVFAKGDGSYHHKYMYGKDKLCKIIEKDTSVYRQLEMVSNLPPRGTCPFPKGNYTFNEFRMDENMLPVALPMGHWMLVVRCARDDLLIGGYKIFASTS